MRTFCAVLLAGAFLACAPCRGVELLDPTALVDSLNRAVGTEKWKKPDFCGKMDCPPFKTTKHTDNYDIRKYDAGKWVVVETEGSKFELAYTKAVAKLLKYFKGGNDKEETIDVTTPTLAMLKLGEDGKVADKNYAFSLWLPEEFQENTPQPTDSDVKVVDFESVEVYVRIFGGFATEGTVVDEAGSLSDILEEEGRDYNDEVVFVAVYDPPQKLLRRHNEIHIPVAAKKQ